MIIDGTDNTDYFFYKFNISKKDQKRLKLIDLFYKEKVNIKNFTEKNFNKIFYLMVSKLYVILLILSYLHQVK